VFPPSSGSVSFSASRIRIRLPENRIRILPSSSKTGKKTPYFYCFDHFYDFLSFKNVNVPSKDNKQKIIKIYFFVAVLKVTDEKSRIRIR